MRSVAGPFSRCGNPNYENFPFYTGPCGPCEPCKNCCCPIPWPLSGFFPDSGCCDDCCNDCCDDNCCDDCCDNCCNDCCDTALLNDGCCQLTATFTASAPIALAAGDPVALSVSHSSADEFTCTPEGIRIHKAGTYMVLYTVHVPANEAVSSRFELVLNGDRIPFSAQDVSTPIDRSASGYTMHATLRIPQDSLLKLVSASPVSIGACEASNVFTLSLAQIS